MQTKENISPVANSNAAIAAIRGHVAHLATPAQTPALSQFIDAYFRELDAEDLSAISAETWCAAALSHHAFATEFHSGAPKMRIFNPRATDHGYTLNSTVIELVNDDMPFLVDSIAMELARQGWTVKLLIHPLFRVHRARDGELTAPKSGLEATAQTESWIHVQCERVSDPARIKALGDGLQNVLRDVRAAVEDWPAMRAKANETIEQITPNQTSTTSPEAAKLRLDEATEAKAFLRWVTDSHFTLLGVRDYTLGVENGEDILRIVPNSGLGILREPKLGGVSASFNELPAEIRALARSSQLLVLTKANSRATVHRPGNLDYIGVTHFDADGKPLGERRFVGLYTTATYHANPLSIPLLRHKIARVIGRAGFPSTSHSGKNLVSLLETYPRDELIQISEDQLFETAMGILRMGERPRTRVFVRRDVYARFFSCLIFVPREAYNTELRVKIQAILKRAFGGTSAEFNVQLSSSMLARIHMLIRTPPTQAANQDVRAIEAEITAAMRRWEDDLLLEASAQYGEEAANSTRSTFLTVENNTFPAAYRENVTPAQAVADLTIAQTLDDAKPMAMTLYQSAAETAQQLRFRVYAKGKPVPLSASLAILENMDVKVDSERDYTLTTANTSLHIHDYGLQHKQTALDLPSVKTKFEAAFLSVTNRECENDGFNRLILSASLDVHEVTILRAYAKYLKQTGYTFSQSYIEQTLASHAGITQQLVALFHARFDPALLTETSARTEAQNALKAAIFSALDEVSNADEDKILRRFLAVIDATLRTNFYQRNAAGNRKNYLSFKLDSAKVPDLPEPKPLFEIFVYSTRFEGIHLRGGKVARGGLRWSDRMEDFRTEVLGLVKAQMVKNSVIVPVGSKGGFVLKGAPAQTDREAYMAYGVACYKDFLRGLLDLTDNLINGAIIVRENLVRHDGDDAYLVVAADKGTATFSDYANQVSAEYGHWLGDAFASGGSVGYDHKKMGITARGAWESVKRHFREMGVNTQSTDFTIAGVGDMSGDVFGNGMLLSKHIKLVAAFDHRHIFLDPTPDVALSFIERERMFALPRSSWDDYDKSLISTGGGVFSRASKSIALSPETRAVLDVTAETMTPQELMRAILKAPVDLFYNGGIGTYIKASTQSHADVGDKATDALRINGNELRCKVVAEGGNLGATQLGRVEYAQMGGRICTDAIDNSAGVDCSDHEVNIKILVNALVESLVLPASERDALLAEMTEEVGLLVLEDNYYQTQALSVSGVNPSRLLDVQARFMRAQERAGRLNRAVEYLPNDEEIASRRAGKKGLTAPERAVLLAYSKMDLFDNIVKTPLVDDAYVAQCLVEYFPSTLRERFSSQMFNHPLKREIIATVVANATINRAGSTFINRFREETGADTAQITRCYILARDVFDLNPLWKAIESLDNMVPAAVQNDMLISIGRLVQRATQWFLRRRAQTMPIADVIAVFKPGVATVAASLEQFLNGSDLQALKAAETALTQQGVPTTTAHAIAQLDAMYSVLDIVEIAQETKREIALTAGVYFGLGGKLDLRWVAQQVAALPTDTHWQGLARTAAREDLANNQRQLVQSFLNHNTSQADAATMVQAWEAEREIGLKSYRDITVDLKAARETDLAMLSVLSRELRALG